MNLRSEINQLVARNKDVFVGLADGTVLRGRFAAVVGPQDDAVAFAATDVTGPAQPYIRGGAFVALAAVCWVETA